MIEGGQDQDQPALSHSS
jgi:hypothetical protein